LQGCDRGTLIIITGKIKPSDHFLKSLRSNNSRCFQDSTGANARVPANFPLSIDCRDWGVPEAFLRPDGAPVLVAHPE
jgi:hypothetical protein